MKFNSCSSCENVAGGSLQVMSWIFPSLKTYFCLLIPPVTDQWTDISAPTEAWAACYPPPSQLYVSVCLMCGQTELLMGWVTVKWRGRVSSSRGSHPCPWVKMTARSWLLKGMGDDTQIGLIYVPPKTQPWLIQSLNTTSLRKYMLHSAHRLSTI